MIFSLQYAAPARIEVLLLTDLLTQTLDIPEAKSWLRETQISDYSDSSGLTFGIDVRTACRDVSTDLARHLSGGLTYSEIPASN